MELQDTPEEWRVVATTTPFQGNKTSVRTDDVAMPDGTVARRDYQVHPGSVAVLALDEQDRVLLLKQYRHPVRQKLWEIPAGLLDVPGENPLHAAQRELYEEAHVKAGDWRVLTDVYTTPGGCDEAVRIFLARDLAEAEGSASRSPRRRPTWSWRGCRSAISCGGPRGRAAQQLPRRGCPVARRGAGGGRGRRAAGGGRAVAGPTVRGVDRAVRGPAGSCAVRCGPVPRGRAQGRPVPPPGAPHRGADGHTGRRPRAARPTLVPAPDPMVRRARCGSRLGGPSKVPV